MGFPEEFRFPPRLLSTPSLGITSLRNSASCPAQKLLSTPSLGITGTVASRSKSLLRMSFQLPLSGSPPRRGGASQRNRVGLSTPSLGITGTVQSSSNYAQDSRTFNSLSRDHSGASRRVPPAFSSFNSLSRDHPRPSSQPDHCRSLSTPSLGITRSGNLWVS